MSIALATSMRERCRPFHEHHLFGARLVDVGEPPLQSVPSHIVLVDLHARSWPRPDRSAAPQWCDPECRSWGIGGGAGAPGHPVLWSERRDHHEDDQQHQKHVNERGDVDVRALATAELIPIPILISFIARRSAGRPELWSVFSVGQQTQSSTPAARTLSTTSTTAPNFARASARTKTACRSGWRGDP